MGTPDHIEKMLDNQLPEGWKRKIIKRDYSVTLGKMIQSQQKSEEETEEYYLRSANIKWGGVDLASIKRMWFSPFEKEKLALKKGDLLVSEGGDVGRTSVWDEELSACYIQNAINRIRSKTENNSTLFLYYWLYMLKHAGYIDAIVSRITIAHLTAEKLERLLCVCPPIIDQIRITKYLEKILSQIEDTISIKQNQFDVLEDLKKSIIHKAVTKGLDESVEMKVACVEWFSETPNNWKKFRIKDVVDISPGFSEDAPSNGGIYTIVPMEAVSVKGDVDNQKKLMFEEISTGLTHFENGDIIFAKITPCMENGKGAYVRNIETQYGFGSTEFHVMRPRCKIEGRFLYYYTYDAEYRSYAALNMTGAAGQKRVSRKFLAYTEIYLPEIKEQIKIANYLDQKIFQIEKLKKNITQQIETLELYRKSIIHECVTGKRRVTEDDLKEL
ncbi:restriction endonuclease subunit S [Desulfobacter latus]|uniref:Restriction endonuclease subunit S n=1 Tax=Desulfobacter latus TaxID=2292 RepID=A0A850SRH2_9BACT|nr:restriction endonuclease subunit S [Desulfobacter latus]NWH04034.1 restriction endonuclease subunit S [Desulfobacter latus]